MNRIIDFNNHVGNECTLLFATMVYPEDELKKTELFSHKFIHDKISSLSSHDGSIEIGTKLLIAFLYSDGIEAILKRAAKNAKEGIIAGAVLYFIMYLDSAGEEASIRRGMFLAKRLFDTEELKEIQIGVSDSKIKKYWQKYKSVAHYWAAQYFITYQTSSLKKYSQEHPGELSSEFIKHGYPCNEDDLSVFLQISQAFLKFGTSKKSKFNGNNANPILTESNMWVTPFDDRDGVANIIFNEIPQEISYILKSTKFSQQS